MQSAQFQLHADVEERHWWFLARRQIVRRLIAEVVPPSTGATIVDVGCGTGANIASLSDAYQCLGIDTSGEAIELAKRRFPRVEFIHGFAPGDLGPAADGARLFTMMDVLEHVSDDYLLLSQMLAAARPGAYILLTVPAEMALWSRHDESFGHYRRYDLEQLRRLWQDLPVTELLASAFNSRLYPLVKLVRTCNRVRRRSAGQAGTDFSLPCQPVNALLARTFAAEAGRLTSALRGAPRDAYRRGVSLIAVLRREGGHIEPRRRPSSAAPDYFDPARGLYAGAS